MDPGTDTDEWGKQSKEYRKKQRQIEYGVLNGMVFLSFVIPAAVAVLISFPMNFFYFMVIVWVHEAGHGFFCISGSILLCAFAGFLNEMLFTLVPGLICFGKKEIYLAGCVFIMCAGMSIQYNGWYMQSAQNPYGMTSFAGALTGQYGTMTEKTHDWSIIFKKLGLLHHSYSIGRFTEHLGCGIAKIFFITSVLAALPFMYGWRPSNLFNLIGCGAVVSLLYFILTGAGAVEITLAVILSLPLLSSLRHSILCDKT